jgi:hypothetical protein
MPWKTGRPKKKRQYIPITTPIMQNAASLWAISRQKGLPTADPKELDGDVILAAQALSLSYPIGDIVVATTNIGHLSQFLTAEEWHRIIL